MSEPSNPVLVLCLEASDPKLGEHMGPDYLVQVTLRDVFAAFAVVDVRVRTHFMRAQGNVVSDPSPQMQAAEAYEIADAMLAERERKL